MDKRISFLYIISAIIILTLLGVTINGLMQHNPKVESVDDNVQDKIKDSIIARYSSISKIELNYFADELQVSVTLNKNVEDKEYYNIFKSIKNNIVNNSQVINASSLRIEIIRDMAKIITFEYNNFNNHKADKLLKWEVQKLTYINNSFEEENFEYVDN